VTRFAPPWRRAARGQRAGMARFVRPRGSQAKGPGRKAVPADDAREQDRPADPIGPFDPDGPLMPLASWPRRRLKRPDVRPVIDVLSMFLVRRGAAMLPRFLLPPILQVRPHRPALLSPILSVSCAHQPGVSAATHDRHPTGLCGDTLTNPRAGSRQLSQAARQNPMQRERHPAASPAPPALPGPRDRASACVIHRRPTRQPEPRAKTRCNVRGHAT